MPAPLSDLHEPLLPILRHTLASAGLPPGATLLDLACGAGEKHGLLAQICRPARIIALDRDRAALLSYAAEDREPRTEDREPRAESREPRTEDREPRTEDQGPRAGDNGPYQTADSQRALLLAGDAQALPLKTGCCDAACCIAALGLFADQAAALGELRRVLRPGGVALVVTAARLWVELVRWPDDLAAQILPALSLWSSSSGDLWEPGAAEDVGGELAAALGRAGFAQVRTRAFLLDGGAPQRAELALLPWAALGPRLQGALDPAALARCAALAAEPEIELCDLVLVGRGTASR